MPAKRRKVPARATPFLMFASGAEAAARFYTSILKGSKVTRFGHVDVPGHGRIASVHFTLAGQEFAAADGGPHFRFSEAFSVMLACRSQREIDALWNGLSKGGKKSVCGWLTDKYGLSWQIVPANLDRMLTSKDKAAAARATKAMLAMKKLDIAKLEKAYRGN